MGSLLPVFCISIKPEEKICELMINFRPQAEDAMRQLVVRTPLYLEKLFYDLLVSPYDCFGRRS